MLFSRRRRGISEAIGSILAIALTLIVGASLFGFVNNQAGSSEQKIGTAAQGNVAYLQERFVVAQVVYTSGSITIDVYNNGQIQDNIVQINVFSSDTTKLNIAYDANFVADLNNPSCKPAATTSLESPLLGVLASSFSVAAGSISSVVLTLPGCYAGTFTSGTTYYVKLLGSHGNAVTYFQGM